MSIETEKWVRDGCNVWVEDCPDAAPRAQCDNPETAKAVVMLPEALAILDDWQREHGKKCDCTRCTKTLEVLRRAGVIP